jgi:CheY-like chemotaxis protein
MPQRPVVAIFNSSPDTVDMLRFVLERADFVVVSAYTWELREGQVDALGFLREHQPSVIVYDVAPPYEPNWRLFEHIRGILPLADHRWVLTTTNVRQVRQVAGENCELIEIIGKPYDLQQVVTAVQRASDA